MTKEEILKVAQDYENVKSFLEDITNDYIIRFEIEDWREGKETVLIVTRGRCNENHYDTFNIDELLSKELELK